MRDVCKQICRLCLQAVPDGNCEPISEIYKEILEVLLINIDFDISDNVACKRCVQKLQDCFEFKSTCFYVDDYITPFVYTDIRVDIKKVFQKVMTNENVNLQNVKICRLCMTLMEDNAFTYNTDSKGGVPLKDVVRNCLPEVNLNTVHEPSICELCLGSMEKLNDFMRTCHEVEQRIKNYYKIAVGHGVPCRISLVDLLKFKNSRTLSILIGIEKDHLDAENALMSPRNEDTISIECETENGVQTDDFKLRHCNSSGDSRSSKGVSEIRTSASKRKKHFCHKCPYSSTNICSVKKHILTHSDNEVHGCTLCSFITNTRLSLQAHMANHRGPTKRYGCPECTFETDNKFCLDQHRLRHKDNSEVKMHKCPSCTYETKYKSRLWTHQNAKHQENGKTYNCKLCSFSTKYKISMVSHQMLHKDPQRIPKYKCEMCKYETKYKSNITHHMRMHENPEVANKFQCEQCPFKTKWLGNLKNHVMTHSIVHPYRCDQCTFSSKVKRYLVKHQLNRHAGGERQMYKCNLCSYQARTSNSVKIHMISTHEDPSEVSKLKCAHCSYETAIKKSLLEHIRRWHGIDNRPKLKCNLCTYMTSDKGHMKQHLNVHREATIQCCQCDFRTKRKEILQNHIKRYHTGLGSSTKQRKISLRGHKNRCSKKKKNDDRKKSKKKV